MTAFGIQVPDIRYIPDVLGPIRDKRIVDISSADFVLESGFICVVNKDTTSGTKTITYRTLIGGADAPAETTTGDGYVIAVAGIPVVLQAVRTTGTTASSITVGIL